MLVWVTRARPAADRTADTLQARGLAPLVSPVLEVRPVGGALDLEGVGALAFTSRNGVEAFARRSGERDLPVFAVGEGTAQAAREAGFVHVEPSNGGGVEALAALIARRVRGFRGAVLHPAARERAADLGALLGATGVKARTAEVYETVEREPAEALARLGEIEAVLVHSPKAGRILAARLDPRGAPLFACISPAAASPLIDAGFEKVRAARFPDEAGLLKLLGTDHAPDPA